MIIELNGPIFGKNSCYLRKKYALSRRSLAKLTGISVYRLRGIENGTLIPALPHGCYQRICEVFHITYQSIARSDLQSQSVKNRR